MSHLPAVLAARVVVRFPRQQTPNALKSFFTALLTTLFDISSVEEKLIGHIKVYGEGSFRTVIRANVTGTRQGSTVEIRGSKPEKNVKIWLNVIAYRLDEDTLRERFLKAFNDFATRQRVKLHAFKLSHADEHF